VAEEFRSQRILLKERAIAASLILAPGSHELELLDANALLEEPVASPSRSSALPPVVYEDEDLLVLNKPSGMPSIPLDSRESETAVGVALARHPELKNIGRGGLEPGILHRLDTGTSGLLVFARTPREFERLSSLWSTREIIKTYRAQVSGREPASGSPVTGTIDLPLAHSAKSAKRMVVIGPQARKSSYRGRVLPARTLIKTVIALGHDLWDLTIEIETGVMHQIRCHLANQGFPILGDPIYGGLKAERLWLHAWKLSLPLRSGARL